MIIEVSDKVLGCFYTSLPAMNNFACLFAFSRLHQCIINCFDLLWFWIDFLYHKCIFYSHIPYYQASCSMLLYRHINRLIPFSVNWILQMLMFPLNRSIFPTWFDEIKKQYWGELGFTDSLYKLSGSLKIETGILLLQKGVVAASATNINQLALQYFSKL